MNFDLVCGTRGLEKAVRRAVRKPRIGDILRGGPTVSLHTEGFGSGVSIWEKFFFAKKKGLIFNALQWILHRKLKNLREVGRENKT